MSSIRIQMTGDTQELLNQLRSLEDTDIEAAMLAVGEAIRTSTLERFDRGKDPEGRPWKTSIRAQKDGGKTLVQTTQLRNLIHVDYSSKGVAVGTNLIYAATHQFGDRNRTIRTKNGRVVHVEIPARPYMGVTDEDMREITRIIRHAVTGG